MNLMLFKNFNEGRDIVHKHLGLPSNQTDGNWKVIAQTWSEHCKHKIFSAEINYTEDEKSPNKIEIQKLILFFKDI